MRNDARRHLVAYDIPDDARRQRIASALSAYGDRIQYSVFIVDAAPVKLARVRRQMEQLMRPAHDSILICDLGLVASVEEERFICLGIQRPLTNRSSYLL